MTGLGGLSLAAEVGDWRRFAPAAQFMGFCGLVPNELLQPARGPPRSAAKAGNAHPRAQLAWVGLDLPARPYGAARLLAASSAGPRGGRPRRAARLRLSARF